MSVLLRGFRVHHWCKNVLLFVPIAFSHQITDWFYFQKALLGFLAFSLCASAVYLLNDLFDLESDKQHFQKKTRPLASGEISKRVAITWSTVLFISSAALSLFLSFQFFQVIACYFLLNILYSVYFKKVLLVDVFILAVFYTIRIFAGSIVTGVEASNWLLAFSMFFFTSLAFIKRYSEVFVNHLKARPYQKIDKQNLTSLGAASGYISVLVLALYINHKGILEHYSSPQYLWMICPLMLFWISRLWVLATHEKITVDPVVFMFKDIPSYVVGLVTLILAIVAI